MRNGVVVHRSKLRSPGLMQAIVRLQPRLVVLEACASAHHRARKLQASGIEVRLITPESLGYRRVSIAGAFHQ